MEKFEAKAFILYKGKNFLQYDFIKEKFWLICLFVILSFATYKYVAYPEPYTFETPWSGDRIELNNNIVTQDIMIDATAKWYGKAYYAICFSVDEVISSGSVMISLTQDDETVWEYAVEAAKIVNGFYIIDDVDYSELMAGTATISVCGVELKQKVYLGTVSNVYNIPNCYVNGRDMQCALAQRYHFYFFNLEYIVRYLLFVLFLIVNIIIIIVILKENEEKKRCLIVQIGLIISFISITYIYDSHLFLEPTWAEAITNFLDNALNKGWWKNLFITDAGYLPLFQRLLTLLIVKVLRIEPYYAIYMMQIIAYIVTGYILSFFVKIQFKHYFALKYRYILCLFYLMQVTLSGTVAFINFVTYGIGIIFLYFLADSNEWRKHEFILLCAWGCLACMSKGSYVTFLPFMILCLFLFRKTYTKRDKIFVFSCIVGSLLQLIYYISYGRSWFDRTGMAGSEGYMLKLILGVLYDVPNNLLSVFENNVGLFNGISLVVIVGFWSIVLFLFIRQVVFKFLNKEDIDKDFRNFFMLLIYIAAQSLFFRITIYGVNPNNIASDLFWNFWNYGINGRRQIFVYIACICFYIVVAKVLQKQNGKSIQLKMVLFFAVCLMIANDRFQIKGIGNDDYCANRIYVRDLQSECILLKGFNKAKRRIVPIQPAPWVYNKNACLYRVGDDIMGMESIVLNDEEDVFAGRINLDYLNMCPDFSIYQIFTLRTAMVNNKAYQVVLKDNFGNVLLQAEQDNSSYQRIVSFTLDEGVKNVSLIEIIDEDGNNINIQNGMYFVSDPIWSEYLKKVAVKFLSIQISAVEEPK